MALGEPVSDHSYRALGIAVAGAGYCWWVSSCLED